MKQRSQHVNPIVFFGYDILNHEFRMFPNIAFAMEILMFATDHVTIDKVKKFVLTRFNFCNGTGRREDIFYLAKIILHNNPFTI